MKRNTSSTETSARKRFCYETLECNVCGGEYAKAFWHQHLLSARHKRALSSRGSSSGQEFSRGLVIRNSKFNANSDILFSLSDDDTSGNSKSIEAFMNYFRQGIIYRLQMSLIEFRSIKVSASLSLTVKKLSKDDNYMYSPLSLRTRSQNIYFSTDLELWCDKLIRIFEVKFEESELRGSN